MKLQISRKYFAGAGSLAVLAAAWFGATLLRPQVSKAFTLIEMPAWVFPEITANPGQNIMACANNLGGDGSVDMIIAVLDVADSSKFLAGTTPTRVALNPSKGSCALLLPAVQTTANGDLLPAVRTGIPVIFLGNQAGTHSSGGGGGAGKGILASIQLVGPNGAVTATTPTFNPNLLLPAVNLP
jgi:hypothetical protein